MRHAILILLLTFMVSCAYGQIIPTPVTQTGSGNLPAFTITVADTLVEASTSDNASFSASVSAAGYRLRYHLSGTSPITLFCDTNDETGNYACASAFPDPDRFTAIQAVLLDCCKQLVSTNDTLLTVAQVIQTAIAADSAMTAGGSLDMPAEVYDASNSTADVLCQYKDSGGAWQTIATDAAAPWSCTWSPTVAGATMLRWTARETGAVYIASDSVAISVTSGLLPLVRLYEMDEADPNASGFADTGGGGFTLTKSGTDTITSVSATGMGTGAEWPGLTTTTFTNATPITFVNGNLDLTTWIRWNTAVSSNRHLVRNRDTGTTKQGFNFRTGSATKFMIEISCGSIFATHTFTTFDFSNGIDYKVRLEYDATTSIARMRVYDNTDVLLADANSAELNNGGTPCGGITPLSGDPLELTEGGAYPVRIYYLEIRAD